MYEMSKVSSINNSSKLNENSLTYDEDLCEFICYLHRFTVLIVPFFFLKVLFVYGSKGEVHMIMCINVMTSEHGNKAATSYNAVHLVNTVRKDIVAVSD